MKLSGLILVSAIFINANFKEENDRFYSVKMTNLFTSPFNKDYKKVDTSHIFAHHYKNEVLYKIQNDTNFFGVYKSSDRIKVESTPFFYYFKHFDSLNGTVFTMLQNNYSYKSPVKEFGSVNMYFNLPIGNDFKTLNPKLIKAEGSIESGSLTETYLVESNVDTLMSSTWTLRFSKEFNDYPFSISPYFDSLKGIKLVEIRSDSPEKYMEKDKQKVGPFVYSIKMEKNVEKDTTAILNLFIKFKNLAEKQKD